MGPAAVKLESSYNRSIKVILELPHATHRGLIEPLSGRRHVKRIFLKRFLTRNKEPLLVLDPVTALFFAGIFGIWSLCPFSIL